MAPIIVLAFPADIGRKPASPVRGSRQRLHAGDRYTPASEMAGFSILNICCPRQEREVSKFKVQVFQSGKFSSLEVDNPKTPNRSGVYIYNSPIVKEWMKMIGHQK